MNVPTAFLRTKNGFAKVLAGLRPFNESVWPGVRNDLFIAHESIYLFASQFAVGARVLDAACGTGYGAWRLAEAGAVSVVGVDIDSATVRFASRRFKHPTVRYVVGDLAQCVLDPGAFDLIVSSNTLEHIAQPEAVLGLFARALAQSGRIVVALPPIYSEADIAMHRRIAYHRELRSVRAWHSLFESLGWCIELFGQRLAPEHGGLDLASPRASRLQPGLFAFEPLSVDSFYQAPSIGAVFVLRREA